MASQLRKLAFVLGLLALLLASRVPSLDATTYSENTCYCNNPSGNGQPTGQVYLYYIHPVYGPWIMIDQWDYGYFDQSLALPPGTYSFPQNYPLACRAFCSQGAALRARDNICAYYSQSYSNRHYQWAHEWHWEDANNDSGGTSQGYDNTGTSILMCP